MRCSHEHVHLLVAIELANPGVQTNQWSGKNPFSDWPEPGEGLCLGAHSGRYNKYDCGKCLFWLPTLSCNIERRSGYGCSTTKPQFLCHSQARIRGEKGEEKEGQGPGEFGA